MANWSNYLGRHAVTGTAYQPRNALDAMKHVHDLANQGHKVRAVGAGHSSADVAQPYDREHWVDIRKLRSDKAPLDWPYYRGAHDHLVRLGAGTTIEEANTLLASLKPRKALYNMGNYDQQTLAGAFSTGTHGSGLNHGPICDRVIAIEMVTDERVGGVRKQRLLRIEPKNGVTDKARFDAEHAKYAGSDKSICRMELEQSDETFDAALINLGCFGVIVAVTLEVRDGFWLEEVETLETWPGISIPKMAAASPEFLQLTLEPHRIRDDKKLKGEAVFIRTTRWEVPARPGRPPSRKNLTEDFARALGWLDTGILENVGLDHPEAAIKRVLGAFRGRTKKGKNKFTSRSDVVHINSLGPHVKATSIDVWVPLAKADRAMDRLLELANDKPLTNDWEHDGWFHTSPVGIRIVGPSRALIAPSFDGPRVSFELPLLYDVSESESTRKKHDLFRSRMFRVLETELTKAAIGGRPHWGQRNLLNDARAQQIYGARWSRWKDVYRRFNGNGTFDNPFTKRMGLSMSGGGE